MPYEKKYCLQSLCSKNELDFFEGLASGWASHAAMRLRWWWGETLAGVGEGGEGLGGCLLLGNDGRCRLEEEKGGLGFCSFPSPPPTFKR